MRLISALKWQMTNLDKNIAILWLLNLLMTSHPQRTSRYINAFLPLILYDTCCVEVMLLSECGGRKADIFAHNLCHILCKHRIDLSQWSVSAWKMRVCDWFTLWIWWPSIVGQTGIYI
jgi:hypothetical protein